jgi:integrase
VKPKSKAGIRVVEIPAPLVSLVAAHLATLKVSNPLNLAFPSQTGTPLYPKNVRRRQFVPALQALGIVGVRQHDFRRTFASLHVAAGTHPKLVQERMGHSNIAPTMDLYARLAGKMALSEEQEARFEALTAKALPAPVPVESIPISGVAVTTDADRIPVRSSDPENAT